MKRTHKEIMIGILKVLNDSKEYSFGSLERKVNTNWESIRDHCEELNLFGAISISKENKVKITESGKQLLKRLNN